MKQNESTCSEWRQSLPNSLAPFTESSSFLTSASLSKPCAFSAQVFSDIMDNLVRNPNITSSHLFRADIYYDSEKDSSFESGAWTTGADEDLSSFLKHIRKELRPRRIAFDGFGLRRVLVRRLVPRNPALDRDLVQTCCFFRADSVRRDDVAFSAGSVGEANGAMFDNRVIPAEKDERSEKNLVVYLPHVENKDDIPWYHPKLKAIGFLHEWDSDLNTPSTGSNSSDSTKVDENKPDCEDNDNGLRKQGTLSIHIVPFESAFAHDLLNEKTQTNSRLYRVLQNLLETICRHGSGLLCGYQKRSHHDRVIPQSALQDTYTRLKQKYAKYILNECWKETTDATKGIFEDLGIAAFLIELWKEMFHLDSTASTEHDKRQKTGKREDKRQSFPGFVDFACGNGVLVYILLSEGYPGCGFDARSRKTWDAFPPAVRKHLHRQVLIPSVLGTTEDDHPPSSDLDVPTQSELPRDEQNPNKSPPAPSHNGRLPKGTFIVSNHADELSAWTPLLGFISECPFICIPCCSHDLTGARFRAAASFARADELPSTPATPQLQHRATTGSAPKQQPSAYAALTAYIAHLARVVGYEPEKEELRIPSTRNMCIVGRKRCAEAGQSATSGAVVAEEGRPEQLPDEMGRNGADSGSGDVALGSVREREELVRAIVQGETRKSLAEVRELWFERARRISCPGNGLASSSKH